MFLMLYPYPNTHFMIGLSQRFVSYHCIYSALWVVLFVLLCFELCHISWSSLLRPIRISCRRKKMCSCSHESLKAECPFYRVPEHGMCHRSSRHMREPCAVEFHWSETRRKRQSVFVPAAATNRNSVFAHTMYIYAVSQ
jgi:hypothetical protein